MSNLDDNLEVYIKELIVRLAKLGAQKSDKSLTAAQQVATDAEYYTIGEIIDGLLAVRDESCPSGNTGVTND